MGMEHGLGVCEHREQMNILAPKTDEVTKSCRKHKEELHNLYRSPNIVRLFKSRTRWTSMYRA